MQWVRAACVRPASCMRVCARSYLSRASIAKTVVDILQQLQIQMSVCLSVCHLSIYPARLVSQLPILTTSDRPPF